MRKPRRSAGAVAAFVALIIAGAVAAPAHAASANGRVSCGYVYGPHLKVESSATVSGNWLSLTTGGASPINLPVGTSIDLSPYQKAAWSISNGSGYWYSAPLTWCA